MRVASRAVNVLSNAEGRALLAQSAGPWGNAKPETIDGIRFPSRTQARVYCRVRDELLPGQRLGLDVRLVTPATMPICGRKLPAVRVDFVVFELIGDRWEIVRLVDAKPRCWASRDWHRGKLALEASYGVRCEEVER